MPNGFVNLQSKLRTIENNVEHARWTLLRVMQSDRFFRNAAGVLDQLQLFNQLVAFVLPLTPIRVRIGPFLNLVARKRIRSVTRPRGIFRLMDVGSLRRYKPLFLAIE